jgi:hypothetical protein
MEEVFDAYAKELAAAPLGAWVRSHYLLFLGEGLQRFSRVEEASQVLQEAATFAAANQIHQISFRAQTALTAQRSAPRVMTQFSAPAPWVPDEVDTVVRAISHLRKAAVAAQ